MFATRILGSAGTSVHGFGSEFGSRFLQTQQTILSTVPRLHVLGEGLNGGILQAMELPEPPQPTAVRPLWEMTEAERHPSKREAFEAFCVYRDLGPDRSFGKVTARTGKAKGTLHAWGQRYNWAARCAAFDLAQKLGVADVESTDGELIRELRLIAQGELRKLRAEQGLSETTDVAGQLPKVAATLKHVLELEALALEQRKSAAGTAEADPHDYDLLDESEMWLWKYLSAKALGRPDEAASYFQSAKDAAAKSQ